MAKIKYNKKRPSYDYLIKEGKIKLKPRHINTEYVPQPLETMTSTHTPKFVQIDRENEDSRELRTIEITQTGEIASTVYPGGFTYSDLELL